MVHCAIYGCNSNNNKNLKRNQNESSEKFHFFRFPKDEIYEKIWVDKCGRKSKINVKNACVCSKHFSRECYIRNLQHELLNYSPKCSKKLKPDAIPTENLALQETQYNEPKETQQKDGDSKKIAQDLIANIFPDKIIPKIEPIDIVPVPLTIDKSTNTEGEDERLLRTQDELQELLVKHKMLLAENYVMKKELDAVSKIFTPAQRKMLQKDKRVKWQKEDISQAIAIYASGPKAYRLLLKRNYPLPSESTLRSWGAKIGKSPSTKVLK